MSFVGRARMWLRAIASRRRMEREMREEISAHLAQAAERFKARGMSEIDARIAAQREFGHLGSVEESARQARGAQLITSIGEDLRHAMRYFARTPLSSITIVLTLALGIGFSSASFSVLQGFLYRPAPGVPDDPALVKIRGLTSVRPYTRSVSWEELTSYAGLTATFSSVVGWATTSVVVDPGSSEPLALTTRGLFVTPNYFSTLRTMLVAGRGFEQSRFDQLTPPELTGVLSHTFAQELHAADPLAMVGKSVKVNGTPVTIVGVTAPRFNGPMQSGEARTIWLPLSAWEMLTGDRRIFNNPDVAMFEAAARLQPGVDAGDALPAVRLVASRARVNAETPELTGRVRLSGQSGTSMNVRLSADVVRLRGRMHRAGPYQNELHQGIPIFSTIALLILLVCTTTVNSLLVGAGVTRRYEIGVRLALGASRWRVIRQLLTEIALLALAAGLLGMYAFGALAQLAEVAQDGYNVTPDGTTTAFTLLYALLTATLCGLSPALHATRTALAEVLKESAVTTTSRSRLQRSFVVAQIAIAMPLLVSLGAALAFLTQGLRQSPHAALRERLIVLNIDTQSGSNATRPDPVPRIMERIAALGGVKAVLPRGTGSVADVSPSDPSASDSISQTEIDVMHIAPGFFEAVDAPVILGRDFAATDSALEVPPLILSDSLAQRLFPSGAIGKRLRAVMGPEQRSVEMEVIGVARAGYGAGFLFYASDAPIAFAPLRRGRDGVVLIRTTGPAEPMLSLVREVTTLEAPGFPISRLTTMSRFDFDRREELKRIGGAGLGSGAVALLMAAIGLYAMLNVAVGQRRREIGVRLAIGARRNQVVGLFFKRGLRTALLGALIGLPFSIIALRWINSELLMPTLHVAGVALAIMSALVLVAAFASWLPARRAATVDPSMVLRSE